jgi:hypothetical protein
MSGKSRLPSMVSDLRVGILAPEKWDLVFKANIDAWKRKGGYQLDGIRGPKGTELFNFWAFDKNARIDFPEGKGDGAEHVIGDRDLDAEVEYFHFPYLRRTEVLNRPSLIVFEVTGHVMLGIYFGNLKRPQLHILNPWPLKLASTQFLDTYEVVMQSSKKLAREILYVDVAGELQTIFGKEYNLQEKERVGFCTLWVGIMASAVIPHLKEIHETLVGHSAASSVLTMRTAKIYRDKVYEPLELQLNAIIDATLKEFPGLKCEYLAAARAIGDLAATAIRAGKRKSKRRTYRKKPTWRQRHGRRSTRRA